MTATSDAPELAPPSASTGAAPDWYRLTADASLQALQSSRSGLTRDESGRRLSLHGPNALEGGAARPAWTLFVGQFADFMILILIAAAVVAAAIGHIVDAAVIVAILLLNAAIGFLQEYRAEHALAALRAMAAPAASVIRGGTAHVEPAANLVPGDVVRVEAGVIVPADLRILDAAGLRVDEAALTGESSPVDKTHTAIEEESVAVADRRNIAHKGTHVTHGRGLGLVIATGMRTEFGKIAALLEDSRRVETPLQRRLGNFGRRLALVVLAICAIVFVTGLLRGEPALPMLLTALSLAVAAIPEALPAVVSISLALGARKMIRRHALIRRLPAVEALGSVTTICSDKTGTLTQNEMCVERFFCDGQDGSTPGPSAAWQNLLRAMLLSNDAVVTSETEIAGDPTEVALVRAALAAGLDARAEHTRFPRVAEVPFDSARKCMSTLHRSPDGRWLSFTKGAVEVLAAAERGGGSQFWLETAERFAADGLRVLAFGVRDFGERPDSYGPDIAERELELLGLVGLLDPPRPEAAAAIATCRSAGIVPIMITGDHPATALAIGRRLGLDAGEGVVTGTELAALSAQELAEQVRTARIYARVLPEQKLAIVAALQAQGEVVAVTGDGVNDAPALKRADIGIAMGITGTDVAKEASGMILLDDNFATVVSAVREGRRIYDNLRRFIRYVLTTNAGELWTIFLAPFLGLPIPLLPAQILWINLVTDGLPGLALAAEPEERDIMRRPPRAPDESVFAGGLGAHAFVIGLLMAGIALGAQAWAWRAGLPQWQTIVFTALCFMQLGHVLAIRSERTALLRLGLATNLPLLGAVLATVLLQLAVIYVPALNTLFGTVPLTAPQLAATFAAGMALCGVVEIEKWFRRRRASAWALRQ